MLFNGRNGRRARIRLLRGELDTQAERSIERTKSVETKASFAVAGAAVVAGTTIPAVASQQYWYVALIPLALAAMAVLFAVRALRPLNLNVPSARKLIQEYAEAKMRPETLEDTLLEVRAVEIENRDDLNEKRGVAMKRGFVFLSWSVISLIGVAALNGFLLKGNHADGQTVYTPKPTHSTKTP